MTPPERPASRSLINPSTHKILIAASALTRKLRAVHADPLYQTVWRTAFEAGIDYSVGPKYNVELVNLEEIIADLMKPGSKTVKIPSPGSEPEPEPEPIAELPAPLRSPEPSKTITNVGGEVITVYKPAQTL